MNRNDRLKSLTTLLDRPPSTSEPIDVDDDDFCGDIRFAGDGDLPIGCGDCGDGDDTGVGGNATSGGTNEDFIVEVVVVAAAVAPVDRIDLIPETIVDAVVESF